MKINSEIKNQLAQLPYFTLNTAKQLTDGTANNTKVLLSRWEKSGQVIRLKKGFYMTKEYWLSHKNGPAMTSLVATTIDNLSYLTGPFVLQKYGVMTEAIYEITSATPRHGRVIENSFGRFVYFHIQKKLINHYTQIDCNGVIAHQATPAKALFDYLYLQNNSKIYAQTDYNLASDLRLNLNEWSEEWRNEFSQIVKESNKIKMIKAEKNLRKYVWQS